MWYPALLLKDNESNSLEDNYSKDEILKGTIIRKETKTLNEYKLFRSPDDFFEYFSTVDKTNNSFHEMIFGESPQRLKFDIDMTHSKIPDEEDFLSDFFEIIEASLEEKRYTYFKQFINKIIDIILEELYEIYFFIDNISPTRQDIVIADSSGINKYSVHIILLNYFLANNEEAQEITRRVINKLPEYSQFIDANVNKKVQSFRLINSVKIGTTRFKRLSNDISDIFETNKNMNESDLFIVAPSNSKILKTICKTEIKEVKQISFNSYDSQVKECLELLAKHNVINGHEFREVRGTLLCFKRIFPSHCVICDEVHHNDNSLMVNIEVLSGDIRCKITEFCRQNKHKRREVGFLTISDEDVISKLNKTKVQYSPITLQERVEKRINSINLKEINPHCSNMFEQLPNTQKNIYNKNQMNEYEICGTLVVQAQMGLGKTKALKLYLEKYNKSKIDSKVIRFISFRQTFASSISKNFQEFELYNNIKGNRINSIDKLIIQVESLHRLNTNKKIDLLILDEIESILSQFNSGLHKNFNAAFAMFQWMLKTSKNVICMDANISDRTYNTLAKIRPNFPIFFHCNKFMRAIDNTYYFTAKQNVWLNKLYTDLGNNKKIVIPTNSLSEAKTIELSIKRMYPDKKIYLYSSETSQSEKTLHFGDVGLYWSMLDILIFTPTCSAGISYELEHFDVVYSYFSNMSCDIETCRQMLERVRNISSKEYYICLNVMSISLPTTTREIEELLKNKRLDLYKDIQFNYDDNREISFYKSNYYYLWLENTKINNLSKVDFINRFIDQISDTGAIVKSLNNSDDLPDDKNEESKKYSKEHKNIKKEIKEQHYIEVSSSDDITSSDAVAIKEKMNNQEDTTNVERLSLEKFNLRDMYQWSESIDSEFVKKYGNSDNKKIYKNLINITNAPTIKEALTLLEKKEMTNYNFTMTFRKKDNDFLSESKDLIRDRYIYIYHSHYYAVTLLLICGYRCITDNKLIHIDFLELNIRAKTSVIIELKDKILFEFSLPRMNVTKMFLLQDKQKFIKSIIRFINLVLKKMYGLEIVKLEQEEFGIKHSTIGKLFSFTGDDKPLIKSKLIELI